MSDEFKAWLREICERHRDALEEIGWTEKKKPYTPVEMRTLVEVVRCKDCKWFDITSPYGTLVPDAFYCKINDRFYAGTHFCGYGERRE